MNPNIAITVRVWCSPRADSQFPWKWAVDRSETVEMAECLEFGAEATEAEAKREATAARASWINILTEQK